MAKNDIINGLNQTKQDLADSIILDTESLDNFVSRWSQDFYNYSLNNWLLILSQKSNATLIAGYKAWISKYGRHVLKGEKALKILAPRPYTKKLTDGSEEKGLYFRAVNVFDVSQVGFTARFKAMGTTHEVLIVGNAGLIEMGCTDMIKGKTEYTFEQIAEMIPYEVEILKEGSASGNTDGKKIGVVEKSNELYNIATLFHEYGHILLDHVNLIGANDISRKTAELEAESVSYIVCKAIGIDNEMSKYYIGNWKGNKDELNKRGSRILQIAEKIVRQVMAVEKTA